MAPKKPSGEIAYNSTNVNRFVGEMLGASETDNRIGSRAKDKRMEIKINKSTFAGSLKFNKHNNHVNGQHLSAGFIGGFIVNPTFHNDINSRQTNTC